MTINHNKLTFILFSLSFLYCYYLTKWCFRDDDTPEILICTVFVLPSGNDIVVTKLLFAIQTNDRKTHQKTERFLKFLLFSKKLTNSIKYVKKLEMNECI